MATAQTNSASRPGRAARSSSRATGTARPMPDPLINATGELSVGGDEGDVAEEFGDIP
jgi:hypothetical protein